jgi:hypothetical protein
LPDKPLVTKLVDKNTQEERVDLNGNVMGSIRLEQHVRSTNGTFMNSRNRVTFIGGIYADLVKLVEENKFVDGSEIDGKIVIIESLMPMWKNQTPKINPQTGALAGVVGLDGKMIPVYMQMRHTEDLNSRDKLIRTLDDVNEILNNQKLLQALNPVAPIEEARIPEAQDAN